MKSSNAPNDLDEMPHNARYPIRANNKLIIVAQKIWKGLSATH